MIEDISPGLADAFSRWMLLIGKQVVKNRSGKPFKSGCNVNTVTGIVKHPFKKGDYGFTFAEDDSVVQCALVKEYDSKALRETPEQRRIRHERDHRAIMEACAKIRGERNA